jgi:hypothetical protein
MIQLDLVITVGNASGVIHRAVEALAGRRLSCSLGCRRTNVRLAVQGRFYCLGRTPAADAQSVAPMSHSWVKPATWSVECDDLPHLARLDRARVG